MTLPWAGCGSRHSAVPQYKIRGKVLSHGEPAAGAIVVLHPLNKAGAVSPYPPRGVVEKDGTFVIGSRMKDDGAPRRVRRNHRLARGTRPARSSSTIRRPTV